MFGVSCCLSYATSEPLGKHCLFRICYSQNADTLNADFLDIVLPHSLLTTSYIDTAKSNALVEVWLSDTPVSYCSSNDDLAYAYSEQVLLISISLPLVPIAQFTSQIFEGYLRLLQRAKELGYPHLLRAWHYLSYLHEVSGDTDRYKMFCTGRLKALTDLGYQPKDFPAATVIGIDGDKHLLYLLCGKHSAIHIENPNQVPAYRYPKLYGKQSPSFARATVLQAMDNATYLLISGTASITGHISMHIGDVQRQCKLSLDNIFVLLNSIPENNVSADALLFMMKVYVRYKRDIVIVEQTLREILGASAVPYVILLGNICRKELLVEIEAVARLDHV